MNSPQFSRLTLIGCQYLYGMPANSAESQLLEAWPASHYRHLRESADLLRMRRENQMI